MSSNNKMISLAKNEFSLFGTVEIFRCLRKLIIDNRNNAFLI